MPDASALTADPKTAVSPQVSVIIPTYNSAAYLPQALDSVLAQANVVVEIIVVDDGSTDNTPSMLMPYAPTIRYIYQENRGSAAARNTGLAVAQADFVVFLDADDYFLPDKLADQLARFEEEADLGLVHSGWYLVAADGTPIRPVEPWHAAPKLNLRVWLLQKPVKLDATMFRRQWLQQVGGLDPSLRQAHDVDLMLRLALVGCRAGWLPRVTVAYRQHARATTRNGRQQVASIHLVLDKFFSREDLPDMARRLEPKVRYYTAVWTAWYLFRTGALDSVGTELEIAQQHTTMSQVAAAGEWAALFARWQVEHGRPPAELMTVWPQFQTALAMSTDRWERLQRLLNWWVQRWPLPNLPPFTEWQKMWEFTRTAVVSETAVIPLESMLDWWVDVWGPYLRDDDMALEGLAKFRHLSAEELLALAQFMMTLPNGLPQMAQIRAFWRDAQVLALVSPAERRLVTRLYLTAFGQALLRRQWEQAWDGYVSALRQGLHPTALRAWGHFSANSIRYWLGGARS